MNKPILAVDVDGVISLFGFDEPPDKNAAKFELVDGMVHCISLAAGRRLLTLGEHYELVWATGWEDKANRYRPNRLGRPALPCLTCDGAARFGSAHWKRGPLDEYGKGGALGWVDGKFGEGCYEGARGREEPTLLVPTEPHLGLEDVQVEALTAWAAGL